MEKSILEILFFFTLILISVKPFGLYMYKVMEGEKTFLTPIFSGVENLFYKLIGTSQEEEHNWKEYLIAIVMFSLFGLGFTSFAQLKPAPNQDQPVKIVKFYPNPATTAINFELPRGYDKSYTIQLFNFMGKKVAEINAATLRLNFSLDGFYRGIYIFQLRDKYGKVVDSGKFQVVR